MVVKRQSGPEKYVKSMRRPMRYSETNTKVIDGILVIINVYINVFLVIIYVFLGSFFSKCVFLIWRIVFYFSLYPALKVFRDDYDYRLIARINPFWLKFEPPTDTYYNTMAVLYMIIFFVGTFGNGLVIYMFVR